MSAIPATRASSTYLARLLIAGVWVDGASVEPILDKYRMECTGTVQLPSRDQVSECVTAAHSAYQRSALDANARGVILDKAAVRLEQIRASLIMVLQAEAGFTLYDAENEVTRCINTFRLSAEEARRFGGELVPMEGAPGQTGRLGFTLRVPLGVICAITPFNAPLNTVAHKVAPALAAGNAVVLKPSLHTPMVACMMADALLAAGLPSGLLSILHGGAEVAQWLLAESKVRFYAFTGSTEVGRAIQLHAGLRRTQMELGSIAHTVVCDDADLTKALPKIVNAGYRKAGQVCTSIQVLLVQSAIIDKVTQRLTELVAALRYGDPQDTATVVGPVISQASAERIDDWIQLALDSGARRLVGGKRKGAVVPPTLMIDVDHATPLGRQEVFGPVMCIVGFDHLDEAIDRINSTPYGLATGVFTNSLHDAMHAARRLEVGGVHINETSSSRVDLMPYGGSKDSGFGREGPHYAIREMSEERMVTLLP